MKRYIWVSASARLCIIFSLSFCLLLNQVLFGNLPVLADSSEITPPSFSYDTIEYNHGGSIHLSYDNSQTAIAWYLWVLPVSSGGDMTVGPILFYRTAQGPPPTSLYWNALDAPTGGAPYPEGNYIVRFEVAYQQQSRTTTGLLTIGEPANNGSPGKPQLSASPLVQGLGGTISFNYTPVSTSDLPVFMWRWGIIDDSPDNYTYTQLTTPQGNQSLSQLPTEVQWQGLASDGRVVPAGNHYKLLVEMLLLTQNGLEYTSFSTLVEVQDAATIPTPTITPLPSPSPTPTPIPSPTPTPEGDVLSQNYATLHPVLFIHGLNSYPSMWQDTVHDTDYFSLLKKWEYPSEYLASYTYTGKGIGIGEYNNQGHIPDAATGMHDAVLALSEVSKSNGGDGQVDIVAHSMGGLIARQYIKSYKPRDLISKLITIGTPFDGSWVLKEYNNLSNFPIPQVNINPLKSQIRDFLLINEGLDLTSYAIIDLTPGSKLLNSLDYSDFNTHYYALYGDINIIPHFGLFNLVLRGEKLNIGDLFVDTLSATKLSTGQDPAKSMFYQYAPIALKLVSTGWFSYKLELENSDILKLKYSHNNLLSQPDVQDRIKYILGTN